MFIFLFTSVGCCFWHWFSHSFHPKSFDTGSPLSYALMPITEQMTLCCVACCHSEPSYTPHLQLSQTLFSLGVPVSEESSFICLCPSWGKGPTFPIFRFPFFFFLLLETKLRMNDSCKILFFPSFFSFRSLSLDFVKLLCKVAFLDAPPRSTCDL